MSILIKVVLLLCLIHLSSTHVSLQSLDIFNVGRFFRFARNTLLGDPRYTRTLPMPFDPYQSDRLRGFFQRKYGYRGEKLVHAIGAGYRLSALKEYGVL